MTEQRTQGRRAAALVLTILALLGVTVAALLAGGQPAPDRVQQLSERLRCPVCKSVSVAESPSDTATAMRQVVAEQVRAGRSDTQIVDFFRARYGDWVLLDPPTRGQTLPLWLAPLVAAGLAVTVLILRARRRRTDALVVLTDPDRVRLDAALATARMTVTGMEDDP